MTFAELHDTAFKSTIQLVSSAQNDLPNLGPSHRLLRTLNQHTPVAVSGTVKARQPPRKYAAASSPSVVIPTVEISVDAVFQMNEFPSDTIMTQDTVFPPELRHLQIRGDSDLRSSLAFRSKAAQVIRQELCETQEFIEIETPLLFKSTPEGAREFLVPTRMLGHAYALPQSPQQYKQILMASGIPRYMQLARCFRDEDHRADRQPEFTQVDLEMAFAGSEDVIRTTEGVVRRLWNECLAVDLPLKFVRTSYEEAMLKYGSDKPDVRFGAELHRIDYMLPVDLIAKIGPLTEPVVEAMKLTVSDDPQTTRNFVTKFMDSPEAVQFLHNPDGQPGIFVVDSRRPLQGLQPFGFEAAEQIEDMLELSDGDLLVIQARKDVPFSGGSTSMGNLRLTLQKAAVLQGWVDAPRGFEFTWIVDFPLFSPTTDADPGQGGRAGLASTHHPFTSPKTAEDVDLLLTDPTKAKADHYDLVCNGVELGGGSRRIHSSATQELIMREVLEMSDERINDFRHLLDALKMGCPPHAGIALGFDRLIAVMLGKESVREVMAFPKGSRGVDALVKSPSRMTGEQLKTYGLQLST